MNMMNKTNLIRLLTTVSLLVLFTFPLSAQEKSDSSLTFRFVAGKDMFFSPALNNGKELERLFDCVDRYKERIISHEIMLHVNGYCSSMGSKTENLAIAKIRSNRVKSELIVRKGLTEDCFITRNHAERGESVTVSVIISVYDGLSTPGNDKDERTESTSAKLRPEEPQAEQTNLPENDLTAAEEEELPEAEENDLTDAEEDITAAEENDLADAEEESAAAVTSGEPESGYHGTISGLTVSAGSLSAARPDGRLALKTNILGYAALMPNAELEWMFADRWSAALEFQSAWYAKDTPHKVYRLATLTPELRFWAVEHARWHGMYVGVFGGLGLYDLSDGKKGHEGEGVMAGLSAGYMWPIGERLSFDAGLGVGYMRARDKVYVPLDGHFLYQLTKNINYIGPLRLKLSLVWRFPSKKINR